MDSVRFWSLASCYGIGVAVENGKDNFQINDITEVCDLVMRLLVLLTPVGDQATGWDR